MEEDWQGHTARTILKSTSLITAITSRGLIATSKMLTTPNRRGYKDNGNNSNNNSGRFGSTTARAAALQDTRTATRRRTRGNGVRTKLRL